MSIDISVPGGNPNKPGFSVQRSDHGLSISAGALADSPAFFGVMNDEGGLSVSAYPSVVTVLCEYVWAYVIHGQGGSLSLSPLRGYITLDKLAFVGGPVMRNICTMGDYIWQFMPAGTPEGSRWAYANNLNGVFGPLAVGDYRMRVYWGSSSYVGYQAIDEIPFTVPPLVTAVTLEPFVKHDNHVAPEW